MKDEKYRVLRLSDLDDLTPKRANRAGNQMKTWCPECRDQHRHRSLQYDTRNGAFNCFYCGLHGVIDDFRPKDRAQPASTTWPPDIATKVAPQHRSPKPSASEQGESRLSDYIALGDEVLDTVADISLDPNEQNPHQLAVRRYLMDQHIPLEAAQQMRWGVACVSIKTKDEEQGRLRSCVAYRNYVDGLCCNIKYRAVTTVQQKVIRPNGTQYERSVTEKAFTQESAYTPAAPYNIGCLLDSPLVGTTGDDAPPTLYVVEGEKDCLVMRLLGFRHVISASNGAQSDPAKMFEAFRPWLAPFGRVVLCGDMDRPGRELTRHLAEYFDDREVLTVEWDRRTFGKDITEVYQRRGQDVAREMVLNAEPLVRTDILAVSTDDEVEAICEMGCDTERADKYSVGIGPLTDRHFMLTPEGGLIIVTGTPNTGKTDFLNFLSASLMAKRDETVCFCSFETPNKLRHLARLAQEIIGATPARALPRDTHRQYVRRVTEHAVHLRMRRVSPTAQNILHKAGIVLQRHPSMRYLIIDPYLYMDVGGGRNITETEAIKHMLTEVQDWAQEHRIWVMIVAHPRKLKKDDGTNELEKIDMYTIAGSANWANIADYILALERVRREEDNVDYTRLEVLKVRDQEVCTPGTVYYQRQPCGRYDERADVEACKKRIGTVDAGPW